MELRVEEAATAARLHPSGYDSSCSHALVEVGVKITRDCGPGTEDLMYGGVRQWQDFANCIGINSVLFFNTDETGAQNAKEVCRNCASSELCSGFAESNLITVGVWGGKDMEVERKLKILRLRTSRLGLARAAGV